jgi:TonB family protein
LFVTLFPLLVGSNVLFAASLQITTEAPAPGQKPPAEVLSDPMGVDFGPYLSGVLRLVRVKWYLSMGSARAHIEESADVTVEFTVQMDGSVTGVRIAQSSGDQSLDDAASRGISASSPLPPLPSDFRGKVLALRFHFRYQPVPVHGSENSLPTNMVSVRDSIDDSGMESDGELVYRMIALPKLTYPRIIFQRDPQYTDRARKAKIQGTVLIELTVTPDGKADDVRVVGKLDPDLDKQAVQAVRSWKFQPATRDGKAVSAQIHAEVQFRLY